MSLTDPDTMNSDETMADTTADDSVTVSSDDLRLLEALLFSQSLMKAPTPASGNQSLRFGRSKGVS